MFQQAGMHGRMQNRREKPSTNYRFTNSQSRSQLKTYAALLRIHARLGKERS